MNHESGLFNRYDIILRSLVAKSILGRKDSAVTSQDCFLLSNYKKMQITRVNRDTTERFSELLRSFSENGLDTKKYPAQVDSLGRILDGAHRVALALNCKKESLVCEVMPFEREIYYGRQWFKENGFDPFLLELLDDEYHNISRNVNFKYE